MKTLLLTSSLLIASHVQAASSCNFTLEHDLLIHPHAISLKAGENDLWRIDNTGQLWLNGKEHATDADTTTLLVQYQSGVRQQAIATAEIVGQAMLLATDALSQLVTELTGKPMTTYPALQQTVAQLQQTTDNIIIRHGNTLEVKGSQLSSLEQAFGDEFNQTIENLVQDSIGTIMLQMGASMLSNQGNFEQRMEAFGQRMALVGKHIEQNINAKAEHLKQGSESYCTQVQQLNVIESKLQQQLPALAPFDLFSDTSKASEI